MISDHHYTILKKSMQISKMHKPHLTQLYAEIQRYRAVFEIRAFQSAVADLQCLGSIQFAKMFTVMGPTPPVHIWLLTSPLPFHLRHVRNIPSQISIHLSKTDKSLTNTSNSRNKKKTGIIPEENTKIIGLQIHAAASKAFIWS